MENITKKVKRSGIVLSIISASVIIPYYLGKFFYSISPEFFTAPMWVNGFAVIVFIIIGCFLLIGVGFIFKQTINWIME